MDLNTIEYLIKEVKNGTISDIMLKIDELYKATHINSVKNALDVLYHDLEEMKQ